MKKILMLSSALILMASLAGCQNCCGLFRGPRLFNRQAAVEPYAAGSPCVAVDPCDPCDTGCSSCGSAASATIVPGPETYVPAVQ